VVGMLAKTPFFLVRRDAEETGGLEPLEQAAVLRRNVLNGADRLNGLNGLNKMRLFAVVHAVGDAVEHFQYGLAIHGSDFGHGDGKLPTNFPIILQRISPSTLLAP
jgi:hypothetical protein